MIAYIPLLAAIVGLIVYVLVANAKIAELGRLMFFAGFLVTMFVLSQHTVRVLAG